MENVIFVFNTVPTNICIEIIEESFPIINENNYYFLEDVNTQMNEFYYLTLYNNYENNNNIPENNQRFQYLENKNDYMEGNFINEYYEINENSNNNGIYNEYSNNNFPQIKHLRGLVNIASTCYMNSILQCFSHITELYKYFKKDKFSELVKNPNNYTKLFPVFREVIIQLRNPYDNSPFSPYDFKKRLGEMNPLFQGSYPNDAKDLLTFILIKLHEELNKPVIKNNVNKNMNNNININTQENKKLTFNNFRNFFVNNYRSIITDLFFGIMYTESQCNSCKVKLYNYQVFNFLIFPLEKVLNYKMSLINYMNNCNNTVSIEDCFQYSQSPSNLNNYFCNKCKNQTGCKFITYMSILPNIIIIILNRGIGLQYNVNISFEENLCLKNYVEYFQNDSMYELIGLVTHYGESSASGHFVARCKFNEEWYLYNDSIVQKIGYFNKDEFYKGNPYILFYKKFKCQ